MSSDSLTATGPANAADSSTREEPLLSFFIPDLTFGGAEQVTINIVNGLSARGYSIELLLSRRAGELDAELDADVPVRELRPAGATPLGVVADIPALVRYLRQNTPAALFPHLSHVSVACLTAKRLLGIDTTIVPTEHKTFRTQAELTGKDRIVNRLTPLVYPTADQIIAVSEGVAESITTQTQVDRDDISVLYNPVDIERVRARATAPVSNEWVDDDSKDVAVYVGRLEAEKDLDTWLRAFERVHDRNPKSRAILVGDGSSRPALEARLETLGLADVVSFPGYIENPYPYMKEADVFVLSSQFEGLPTVLIEALACECPVVATDCPGGTAEILGGGEVGRLVPVGDAEALASAIHDTLADPTDGDKLRERAESFAPESVFDTYERFLDEHVFSSTR
jgi:glycosyltransferase involved in cell wall biosynthesis